jgi:hypothetical protein
MATTAYLSTMVLYLRARLNVNRGSEEGLTTLEICIWAAVLSGAAIAAAALVVSKINAHSSQIN